MRIATTDYAEARKAFRTHLLVRSPSPQEGEMPVPPAGAERISFPSAKRKLSAWVGHPDGATGPTPVVLFLHGGFAFGADDYTMAEPFRRAGFTIVTPILRGENGQAGDFSLFYDEVDDVVAAAEYVRTQPWADPQRVFLAGHSAGGTLTLLAACTSDVFRAAASFSGEADEKVFSSAPPWSDIVPFDLSDPREFEMRSALTHPASFKAPTRLCYGTEEQVFRPVTDQLVGLAKAAGRDVDSATFPGDHFTAVPAEIDAAITFFRSQM